MPLSANTNVPGSDTDFPDGTYPVPLSGLVGVIGNSANVPSTLVARDASGNFAAGTITAALTGNATTATTAAKVANVLTAGSYLTSGGTFDGAAARTFAVDAATAATASKVVARDASGDAAVRNLTVAKLLLGGITGTPVFSVDIAGSTGLGLNNDASATLVTAGNQYSVLLVSEISVTGASCIVFVSNGQAFLVWQSGASFTVTNGTANKYNISASTTTVTFENKLGSWAEIRAHITHLAG